MNIESLFSYVKTDCSLEHILGNSYSTHLEVKFHSEVKYILKPNVYYYMFYEMKIFHSHSPTTFSYLYFVCLFQ